MVHTLERLLGGTSVLLVRQRPGRGLETAAELSFGDVAILYRTEAQAPPLIEALGRAGIPFQKRSHRPLAEQPGVRGAPAAPPGAGRRDASRRGWRGPSGI